ncbi:hypothetical protein ACZ90_07330 [Streptomyces albus subsp. albus]|nr:hypothetical protein ACZ90_07330 [Streptomyces albus subsp. albus]
MSDARGGPVSARRRLLPWSGPGGQPAYLVSDGGADSHLWRLADQMEAVQLRMSDEMIGHAQAMVNDRKVGIRELRFVVRRMTEALIDTRRIADSRGMRLSELDDGKSDQYRAHESGHGTTEEDLP